MKRPPEKLPDPWLFDTETLLRELDRCREMILLIPATTHAAHFASNIAIDAIWNLRENLRYLVHLHREGQRQFAKKARPARVPKRVAHSQDKIRSIGAWFTYKGTRALRARVTRCQSSTFYWFGFTRGKPARSRSTCKQL